jgi:hypothetical protein
MKQGIYVELDCLLDTRLATLYQIKPELVQIVLDNGYLNRDEDAFYGVPKEVFKEIYDARDKSVLVDAMPTKCMKFITEIAVEVSKQYIDSPYHEGGKLVVNTYPYKLTDEEAKNIIAVLAHKTAKMMDIQLIHQTPDAITPMYVEQSFAAMFMYDSSKWFDVHSKNQALAKTKIPDITLFMPAIYFGRKPTEEEIINAIGKKMTGFEVWEISSKAFINATVVSTDIFSVDIDHIAKLAQKE